MNPSDDRCDLCDLPLSQGAFPRTWSDRTYRFCCPGCRQVFSMLLDITGSADPEAFRASDIYRRCREMGVVPSSEADLASAVRRQHPDGGGEAQAPPEEGDPPALSRQYLVAGMWCPACAWVIEEVLLRVPGVSSARCLFATDRLQVRYDPALTPPEAVSEAVAALGYRLAEPHGDAEREERRRQFIRFFVSAFLAMNVMMLSFALYSGFFFELPPDAVWKLSWPIAVLATAVMAYGGAEVHRRGWQGIVAGAPGMESLIMLGADAAWLLSAVNLLRGSLHLYFDTAAMLITLVLLGKLLERRARDGVQADLHALFSLAPRKARICSDAYPDGRYADIDALRAGMEFRVEEGEVVPADGVAVRGGGTVDESAITGEATPVEKGVGDRLLGGTRVDGGGFRVRAERTGPDSTLGQMTAIVEAALDRKAAMEGLTDRLLRGFVPVIVLLAVGTGAACRLAGLGTEAALLRAITVMVISCPCALGIAIPLARVAGISLAGRKGILVQAFQAFETAGRLGHVVFDKTGTLTRGRWELLRVEALEGGPVEDLLALAAGLEAGIDHPVARAVGRAAAARGIRPAGCTGVERLETGVAATCGGRRLRIGSAACLGGWLDPAAPAGRRGEEPEGLLASRVYLGIDGRTVGVLVFGDRLKEAAADTVARLRSRGLAVSLVSGDGEAATRAASRVLGIDDAVGGRLPAEKAAIVAALRGGGGRKVAMVGDGMNDGPALAASDLGVALYGGAHLGREAAEVTLMRGDPRQLLEFLDLAAAVHRKVVQNLALTFAYNLVAIPVAMSGLLSPLVAVTAMLLSSLSVTGNTVWLVRRGR